MSTLVAPELMGPDPSIDLIGERHLCKISFFDYIGMAWSQVEPKAFHANWHIEAMAEHLQAVTDGQIENLLINIPPGTSKSLTTCVMWPTWEWGPRGIPEGRWLFGSYDQQLSTRDAMRARQLIDSPWYRERWPEVMISRKQDEKTHYETTKGGYRISTSIGGHGTGQHPTRFVCDDPHNVEKAESDTQRETVVRWFNLTMGARGVAADIKMSRVIVMQRLHQGDLAGYVLAKEPGQWVHLMLPMYYEPKRASVTVLGFKDPRKEEDELLDPVRFPESALEAPKKRLGSYGVAGQFQQRPDPHGGGEIKREWWRYYDVRVFPLGPPCELEMQSWDTALTDTTGAAKTAAILAGRDQARVYLKAGLNEQMSTPGIITAVANWATKFPKAVKRLIENSAAGPGVYATLRHRISGLQLRKIPKASKMARLRAVSPFNEAGNVYLPGVEVSPETWIPDPAQPWVAELIEQCALGLASTDKDLMDAYSQLMAEFEPGVWTAVQEEEEKAARAAAPVPTAREEFQAKLNAMRDRVLNQSQARRPSPYGRRR